MIMAALLLLPPHGSDAQSIKKTRPALVNRFSQGESIYRKPNAAKVFQIRPDMSTKAPNLFEKLISITARYESLEQQRAPSRTRTEQYRLLAREKVQLYAALGITQEMLGLDKNDVGRYLGYWQDFWARTDRWKGRNGGSAGHAGPFSLPRSPNSLMSRLIDGPGSSLASLLEPAQAYASTACPICSFDMPMPLPKCNEDDEEFFYFASIQCWDSDKDYTLQDWQVYDLIRGGCSREKETDRWEAVGTKVYLRFHDGDQVCPRTSAMADVAGKTNRRVSVEYDSFGKALMSMTSQVTYCAPTKGAERYHKEYDGKVIENKSSDGQYVAPTMPCD